MQSFTQILCTMLLIENKRLRVACGVIKSGAVLDVLPANEIVQTENSQLVLYQMRSN
jgi:hypothetical protein